MLNLRYHSVLRKSFKVLSSIFLVVLSLALLLSPALGDDKVGEKNKDVNIKLTGLWDPGYFTTANDPLIKLMDKDPTIKASVWSGIRLPGGGGRTSLLMAIAGQTAPDLFQSYFHIIRNDINQGFPYPLNEWIGDDTNHNGYIDPEEAKWDGWKNVPPLWRQVATVNGKVYGVPVSTTGHWGIIFRSDLVRRAGLDPNKPPETWDEFFYWCQKLTSPKKFIPGAKLQRGQKAFVISRAGWLWIPWIQSCGGCPIEQLKRSPKTGKTYSFQMEETTCIAPDTKEDLSKTPSEWRANIDSPEALKATAFLYRLRWQKWIHDPQTNEPINLTKDQAKKGEAKLPNGRIVHFNPKEVIIGVVRSEPGGPDDSPSDWLARGEAVMVQSAFDDLSNVGSKRVQLDSNVVGVFPVPAGPGGRPVVQLFRHYAVMSEGVGRRSKYERDKIWKVLTTVTSEANQDENIRRMVLAGKARFINPDDLKRLKFQDYVKEVPTSLKKLYADMDSGKVWQRTEPFMGYWATVDESIGANVLGILLSDSGEGFNYTKALHEVNVSANTGQMFARKPDELKPYRKAAWIVFSLAAAMMLFFIGMIISVNLKTQTKTTITKAGAYHRWIPWLMLFPALGLVALWGYYPLLKGAIMAFQDYHIVGAKPWVGLDNFISIFLDPDFYISVRQTLKYVALSLAFVFTAPIMLALLLSEIPKGKIFWRSVFFLPQLTSGLVVILLWKQMYNPTEIGILNQVLSTLHIAPVDWLGNAKLAMIATIIPTIWAGTGMGSLIYLAALKGIPDELYEAAALDGSGIISKLRFVTIPQLMPLIMINFVGAFIGTFQSMGNIFLLTFGGPGKETRVLSMAIWLEAYTNLRFSMATSMGWILGSVLVGFAYLQIRILRKVEFRRVDEV